MSDMALSTKARKRLEVAVTSKVVGAEIADSIDRQVVAARVVNLGTPDAFDTELLYVEGFKDGHARTSFGSPAANHAGLVVKARAVNVNNITFVSVGDSVSGVTVEEAANTVTVHFEDGVSTGNDVVAAVETDSLLVTLEESNDMPDPWAAPGDEMSFSVGGSVQGTSLSQANTFTSTDFGDFAVSMNLHVIFGNTWNGGLVTVVGVGQDGDAATEVFDPDDGADQLGGVAFASVTSATKEFMGTNIPNSDENVCSINIGGSIGLGDVQLANNAAILYWTSSPPTLTTEQPAFVDVENNTIKPAVAPTGTETYSALVNVIE